jgi:hypothetical protein
MMHGHAHGITRRAVHLLSIPRQREDIILNQIPQPVLYVRQQAVKLVSGSGIDIHWSGSAIRAKGASRRPGMSLRHEGPSLQERADRTFDSD